MGNSSSAPEIKPCLSILTRENAMDGWKLLSNCQTQQGEKKKFCIAEVQAYGQVVQTRTGDCRASSLVIVRMTADDDTECVQGEAPIRSLGGKLRGAHPPYDDTPFIYHVDQTYKERGTDIVHIGEPCMRGLHFFREQQEVLDLRRKFKS